MSSVTIDKIIHSINQSTIGYVENIRRFHILFFKHFLHLDTKDNLSFILSVYDSELNNIIKTINERFSWFNQDGRKRNDGKIVGIDIIAYTEPCESIYGCDSLYLLQLHTLLKFNVIVNDLIQLLKKNGIISTSEMKEHIYIYFMSLFFNVFEENGISGLYSLSQLRESKKHQYKALQKIYRMYKIDDRNRISNTHIIRIIEPYIHFLIEHVGQKGGNRKTYGGKRKYTKSKTRKTLYSIFNK